LSRRLGQHFLRSAWVERLVRLIDPRPGEVFLEIGPGRGALTLPLAAAGARVVAVELDARLAADLRERAPGNVEIVTGDALEVDLRSLVPAGSRLAGNLPYYVASPLLRRFLELKDHVRDFHALVQEEMGERVASPPGSRDYGVLSVLIGLWADLDLPLRLPPGAFDPPPRVRSAVLRGRFLAAPRASISDPSSFQRLVLTAFTRRRRTLENNLQHSYPDLKNYLRLAGIEGSRRAESLSVAEFARLDGVLGEAGCRLTSGDSG
jgi:16S rRNA (adenine1518-N6/adenine1519-N6)-dimethyltransferase